MIKPISPAEAEAIERPFPDAVYEAFNELIAKYFRKGRAEFLQKEVVTLILSKDKRSKKNNCLTIIGWM